jgi:hypothetical protein
VSSNTDALPGAPFSPELLADLHADALPEDVSSRLWPLVRADAEAMRILATLDTVTARLHELGEDPKGTMPVPADVARQIDRTLETLADTESADRTADVLPLRRPPRSARTRRHVIVGIAAAAALLAGGSVTFAAVLHSPGTSDPVVAEPGTTPPDSSLVLDSTDLDSNVALTVIGKRDPGSLSDPADLAACLDANGVDPAAAVLGSSQVRIDGRQGTLLVLAGAGPAQFIALAVGNDCRGGNPDVLTRRDIG